MLVSMKIKEALRSKCPRKEMNLVNYVIGFIAEPYRIAEGDKHLLESVQAKHWLDIEVLDESKMLTEESQVKEDEAEEATDGLDYEEEEVIEE